MAGDNRPALDFRALFEAAPDLYLVLAPDLTIVAVSDAYLRATLTVREAILGRSLFEVFPDNPDDATATGVANLRASLSRVLKSRAPDAMAVQKYDLRRSDGSATVFEERYWSPINSPVCGPDGAVSHIIHRVEDVTEFVRLKERGHERDRVAEELRTRAGQMEVEVYRRAQEVQEANRRLRELQAELESRVAARTAALHRESAGREQAEEALRQKEEQLRHAQKMEAVGRLAGGIAHDFNNVLSVILSYSDMILSEVKSDDPVRGDIEEIRTAGKRAADLTRQLLLFSHQQVLEPKVLDLNDLLGGMEKMIRRLVGEDVELVSVRAPCLGKVTVDPGSIEQVIMNLVVNARDAMPTGGKLTIETANTTLSEAYAQEHLGTVPGPHVMLAVTDTGTGMDRATRARIFEPFFTTKDMGKGTGLGLSTVFGIVKQSRGSIWVYSEPGKGTSFKVYLPLADGAVEEAPRKFDSSRPRGSETILLVEDEEQVRDVARGILRRQGYRVLEASHGGEALALCRKHAGRIDLLLSDVVMPHMSGPVLARMLGEFRPEMRILCMSGYTDDSIVRHGVLDGHLAFLQKPFTPETLLRKVRDALGSRPADPPSQKLHGE